jgi:hypothetical protein
MLRLLAEARRRLAWPPLRQSVDDFGRVDGAPVSPAHNKPLELKLQLLLIAVRCPVLRIHINGSLGI